MDKIDKKESKLNNKSDFYYHLPESLIAQRPLEPRDSSRLMVLGKESGKIEHDKFFNLTKYKYKIRIRFTSLDWKPYSNFILYKYIVRKMFFGINKTKVFKPYRFFPYREKIFIFHFSTSAS